MSKIRPPKAPPKVRVQVDMPAGMGNEVRALAQHDGKSMNAFILMLLSKAIPVYCKEAGLDDG